MQSYVRFGCTTLYFYFALHRITNREERKLTNDIEDKVTEFNWKFNNTELDSKYFVDFLEQNNISEKIIQRVFNSYNTSKEDYETISNKLAVEAIEFVNNKKDKFNHPHVQDPSCFEDYFFELFKTLFNYRESLLSLKDKAALSIVDESIAKSIEGKLTQTINNIPSDKDISRRLEELNKEYKSAFNTLENGLIQRREFSICRKTIESGKSLIIHGKAGRGKSGCTVDVINYCEEKSIPYLAIKLDKRIPNMTAEKWGSDLGLPASITESIHSVSENKKAVIILDQLDALRWTLAHSRDALLVCSQIINQVEELNKNRQNKISVVFVCRTYDLENDNNIRPLFKSVDSNEEVIQWTKVQINEMDEGLVQNIIGSRYKNLTNKLKEILKIPSNLYIWQQLDEDKMYAECSTASHLISKWWEQLSEKCFEFGLREDNLNQIKEKMVSFLGNSGRIFIPLSMLDKSKSYVKFLSSNAFLVIQDNKVSFAHQSILDCFLAERMLERYYDSESIVEIIGNKENQTPAKRYQVQMFLENLLEFDSQDFISVGKEMFEEIEIRYFVKFVFLEILNQISYLDENIQNFIIKNCENEIYGDHLINTVLFSRPNYIRVLRQSGVLEKWFNDPLKKNLALNLLISMSPNYETDDIEFIRRCAFYSQEDANKLSRCFMHDIYQDTDELFELRMEFYYKYPHFAETYLDIKTMLEKCEMRTIRLLTFFLENKIKSNGRKVYKYEEEFILEDSEILINNGVKVVNSLLEFVPKDIDESLKYSDWSGRYPHRNGLERACLQIIKKANGAIIEQNPDIFFSIYGDFMGDSNDLYNEIILDGLYRLPGSYSDAVINFMCSNLNSNILDKTSGNGDKLYLAKKVFEKHSKTCGENVFDMLEERVCRYISPDAKDIYRRRINFNKEKNGPTVYWSFWGEFQKEILEVLSYNRLSVQAKELMRILQRKFPEGTNLYKYSIGSGGWVSSPVSGKNLNDNNWLKILTNSKLDDQRHSRSMEVSGRVIENSIEEFGRSFSSAVSEQPKRMLTLFLSNKDIILDVYVNFLFSGVAYSDNLNNVPTDLLETMILTYPYDYVSFRADYICTIIRNRENAKWSEEVLSILKDIAINHTNPISGKPNITNNEDKEMRSFQMLQSNSMNCVRGKAAEAIAQLLWNDKSLFAEFKGTIEKLAMDENPAVNLASLSALCRTYNIESLWTSEIILMLFEQDYRLAGFHNAKNILFTLYPKYRERVINIIKRCYKSDDVELLKMGAYCLSEMYILKGEFRDAIDNVEEMGQKQAEAVLHMTINYFSNEDYKPLAKELVLRFKSSTLNVEIPISRLFYKDLIDLESDKEFLIELMNSDLSRRTIHAFVNYLEEESKSLVDYKDIILSMSYHLLRSNYNKEAGLLRIEDEISKLIIGLYDETSVSSLPELKDIANQCLNIWDLMFEKQIGPVRYLSQQLMER
ncbi:hypothetical protein [Halobacillus salinus]|uniref:hypothetical protein n=1 Tax=Halobacillus salinus TaxID=192814 RepID=UPI0009A6E5DA|nr:hypothetical protein [Halobacillus salinus]